MRLLFKQRFFSWFDSYDIFDENGNTVFCVKGQMSWGHCFKIFDMANNELGMVKQKILTLLPKTEVYADGQYKGSVAREFSLFKPKYVIDFMGWRVEGDFFEWDYHVFDACGNIIAEVSKQLLHWTDTYSIEVFDEKNVLVVLMLVLSIDAEKCSRND